MKSKSKRQCHECPQLKNGQCMECLFLERPQSDWFILRPQGEIPDDVPGHVLLTWEVSKHDHYHKYGCRDLDGFAAEAMKLTTKKQYFKDWVWPEGEKVTHKMLEDQPSVPYEDAMSGAPGAWWITSDLARQSEAVVGEQELDENPELSTVQAVADAASVSITDTRLPSERRDNSWKAQVREPWEDLKALGGETANDAEEKEELEEESSMDVPKSQEMVAEVYDGSRDDVDEDWTAPLPWQREEDAFIRAIDASRSRLAPKSKEEKLEEAKLRSQAEVQAAKDGIAVKATREKDDKKRYNRPAMPHDICFPNDQTTEKYEYWRQIRGMGKEERPATLKELETMDWKEKIATNGMVREWKRTDTAVEVNTGRSRTYKIVRSDDPEMKKVETRKGRTVEDSKYNALTVERAKALNESAILCRGGQRGEAWLGYQGQKVPDGNKMEKGLDGNKTGELDIRARLEAMCCRIAGNLSPSPLFLRDNKSGKLFQSLYSARSEEEQAKYPPMPMQAAQKLRNCICQQPDRDAGDEYVSSWPSERLFKTGKRDSHPMLGDGKKGARDPRHCARMDAITSDSKVTMVLKLDAKIWQRVVRYIASLPTENDQQCKAAAQIKGDYETFKRETEREALEKMLSRFPDWLERVWKYKEASGPSTFDDSAGWEITEDKGTFLVVRFPGVEKSRKVENKNFDSSYPLKLAKPTDPNGWFWDFERGSTLPLDWARYLTINERKAVDALAEVRASRRKLARPIRPGKDDFSIWADTYIAPKPATTRADVPVLPLTRWSLWSLKPWREWPDWEEQTFIDWNHFAGGYWFNQMGRKELNRLSDAAHKHGQRVGKGLSRRGKFDKALADQEWMNIYWSGLDDGKDARRLAILRRFGGAYRLEDLPREECPCRFLDKIEDPRTLEIHYVWRSFSSSELEVIVQPLLVLLSKAA
jgi:hypothetical protein